MNENEKRIYLLEKENIKKALLKLGIPTMIGMLVSALYNIVDAFFIGRLGTLQTAAVSVVYPLTMVASGIGLLFGCGAGSYISRLLGRKKYEDIADCSSTALFSGIFISIAVVGGMMLFFEPLIYTLGATKSSITYAKEYGMIYLFGLIFNVFNMMMNNMLVAEGNSRFGMTAMLVPPGVNTPLYSTRYLRQLHNCESSRSPLRRRFTVAHLTQISGTIYRRIYAGRH
ncbi:MATE family efflux transporter [uncultured Robinsoniella sp.]|uniref:MATE family efflux transporter n=1 Tax=uncultured Robinsoniella sp. TaxID=904190 RepID=UPI00374FBFA5